MAKKTAKKRNGHNQKQASNLQLRKVEDVAQKLAATPLAFMKRFGEDMENLFDDFGFDREWLAPIAKATQLAKGQGLWSPQVEMFERKNEIVVRADLPGLKKDDVKVEVAENGITIEGERKHENVKKGDGYYRSERSYGKFSRRLPLPDGVDPEDATATFQDGVLEVSMPAPKRTDRKSRRLEIAA